MANIKFKDIKEGRDFVIIDPRGNARPVGSKIQASQYLKKMGGAKQGWHMVLAKNALKARRAIEKNGGNSTNSKIQDIMFDLLYEGKLNEVTAKDMLQHAVNALTKTFGGKKLDQRYVKEYLKSIEQMARKNPGKFVKDYGKFKFTDWIEDVEYNLQNEGKVNEGMSSLQKKVRNEIDGMAINHYQNVQNEFGIGDDSEMQEFIEGLSDSDAKKLLQQIKKKMFEGKLKENKMIKFKDILKEAAWDHTSGKALPTLEDVQKAYEAKKHLQEELPIEEGDNTQYSWGQINSALMKNGMSPKNILRFLSILKKI